MKYIILIVLFISTFWCWHAFPDYSPLKMLTSPTTNINEIFADSFNLTVGMFKYNLISASWITFIIYSFDFVTSTLNYNTPYMRKLYKSCRLEVATLFIISLITFFIFWDSKNTFTNSSVDIAMAGLSFMIGAHYNFLKLFKFKIGRVKYPIKIAALINIFMGAFSFYIIVITNDIAMGRFNMEQSIWLQITVITYSLSLYFSSKYISYVIKTKTLGVSPIILEILKSLKPNNNMYEDLAKGVDIWNKKSREEKAIASSKLRKRNSKKRKRK
ncbi:hypothetical protein [Erwinia mallotivora]|uniref:Uncharacterized protein n=1 Tax=Erwinia mallotivora TaxID=69222 RepID=A0A014NMW8_9GAMM|nr:hypothetical protein [Erwinia mallotivora]EXU75175.1 hypothetical protein BG55_12870 [Erwinia mallotivora]